MDIKLACELVEKINADICDAMLKVQGIDTALRSLRKQLPAYYGAETDGVQTVGANGCDACCGLETKP